MLKIRGAGPGDVSSRVCASPTSIATADFNADGNLDIAVGCSGGDLSILLGSGSGSFSVTTSNPAQWGFAVTMVSGDFNRDGHPDLAIAGNTAVGVSAAVLLGDGAGHFTPRTGAAPGPPALGLATGDFNCSRPSRRLPPPPTTSPTLASPSPAFSPCSGTPVWPLDPTSRLFAVLPEL